MDVLQGTLELTFISIIDLGIEVCLYDELHVFGIQFDSYPFYVKVVVQP